MNKILLVFLFLWTSTSAQLQWKLVSDYSFNRDVQCLFSDSLADKLYIGGNFKFYGGVAYKGVAMWDGMNMLSIDCGLGGCGSNACGGVRQFEKYHNELYASFPFEDSIGCMRVAHLAKWDGTSWVDLHQPTLGINLFSSIFNLDSILLVAGPFDSLPNKSVLGLAKYNGSSWDTAFQCSLFDNSYLLIHPFGVYDGRLYAQNLLRDTLGNRQIFSYWNGKCWEKVPGAFSNNSGSIWKMIVYKNKLYVAGAFDRNHDPAAPGSCIASWDGNNWSDLGGGITLNNPAYTALVDDMVIYHDELFVVGYFEQAGSVPSKCIAKWDGNRWCSFNNYFDNTINTIAIYHDSIFIGGAFFSIDGDSSITNFAKCFPNNHTDSCSAPIGIAEIASEYNLLVYPLPALNMLHVKSRNHVIKTCWVNNLIGEKLMTQPVNATETAIDIRAFPPGIYFLLVETADAVMVKKFLIAK